MRIRRARVTFEGSNLTRHRAGAIATAALRGIAGTVRRSPVGDRQVARISVTIRQPAAGQTSTIAGDVAGAVAARLTRRDARD